MVVATQAERSGTTSAALIAAARELFASRGWAATSMEEVARAAGVTKGALYHHFADKKALLRGVYEDQERRSIEHLLEVAGPLADDPLEGLRVGSRAFLESCLDPTFRRIALVEAPAGLGWELWREIDLQYGFGLMHGAVQQAIASGQLKPLPVDQVAHQLLAALMEAALLVGQAKNPKKTLKDALATYNALLDGLTA
jgi:AcrR family transcriptional regulator